jgi:flagellar basal-body rod modification protein FlgD
MSTVIGNDILDSKIATSAASSYAQDDDTSKKSSRSSSLADENMFLKILSAELANQDPTNSDSQSGTEYVSQLAQFSALQQMLNLNETSKLGTANSMVNKFITSTQQDSDGNPIGGLVTGVLKDGDDVYLNVLVGQNTDKDGNTSGDYKKINIDDVSDVEDLGDTYNTSTNNILLLNASSLIGKKVETSQKDADGNYYSGTVESVSRSSGTVIVIVKLSDGTEKQFDFNDVSSIENK